MNTDPKRRRDWARRWAAGDCPPAQPTAASGGGQSVPPAAAAASRTLPTGIWTLGLVSMLMDVSSELVHSLLPVFMTTVLGASMTTIGLIEGVAEATAAMTKVASGAISDYLGKRKLLAVLGYGLAAVTKPVFPLATTVGWVFAARFVDRVGKGIRGAPRDALMADITPSDLHGAAYGLRQSLDSAGAFLGPLLAVAGMAWFANDIRAALWGAVVPAFAAVALLAWGVREPDHAPVDRGAQGALTPTDVRPLPLRYWLIVLLGGVFTLARFSEAFLVLRAREVGLAIGYVPLVMIVMNVAYATTAYPAGLAADRIDRRTLLVAGLAVLVAGDIVLAAAGSPLPAFVGAALWGVHMGLTQGVLSALVAGAVPTERRGTAFGLFNLVSGGALLLASVIAGVLWSAFGAAATFSTGAGFAALAALGLLFRRPSRRRPSRSSTATPSGAAAP
jgi:MFS family permease